MADDDDWQAARKKRWRVNEDGTLAGPSLESSEIARLGETNCGLRLDYLSEVDTGPGSFQIKMDAEHARKLAAELNLIAHYAAGTDPRPQPLRSAIDAITRPSAYPSVGRCIYCSSTRHSKHREHLGDEHIIPFALNGDLVLPSAACGECEGKLNWFEQYCHKLTFGPLRYYLGLATRNPKERPLTLPLECTVAGEEVIRDVPLDSAPTSFILPFFDLPDICADNPPIERNIYTRKFLPSFFPPITTEWLEENKISGVRSYEAPLEGNKFALLIAKIAHSYSTAECINDPDFSPLLAELVRKDVGSLPLAYLVGGEPELVPPTDNLHEVQILRRRTAKRALLIVRVRLFAYLGTPTYYAVASAQPAP